MTPLDQSISLAPAPSWEPQPTPVVTVAEPEPVSPHSSTHKRVKERLGPFIGSGMTLQAVATILDCSVNAVHLALKRKGVKL